jgi:putative methionine-R-sulfoxide reductase with GAF domain
VPLLDAQGGCRTVLDVDSYDLAAFNDGDVTGMTGLLMALRLTSGATPIEKL